MTGLVLGGFACLSIVAVIVAESWRVKRRRNNKERQT